MILFKLELSRHIYIYVYIKASVFKIKLEITAVLRYANSMRLLQLSADLEHAHLSQESHFYSLPDLFVMELNVLRASIFNTEGKISDLCESKHL